MSESNINLENTAFFDNVTWLNQANWQNYFGKTLPNGVIVDGCLKLASNGYTLTGTMDITSDESNVIIGTGAVMANGLYTENNAVVQIPHVTSAESTKLICVKFDLALAKASIITKTSVLDSGANVADAITALNLDESYLCTRNAEVYEIPLAFDTYAYGTIDLRRLVYAPSGKKHHLAITTSGTNQNPEIGVVRGRGHCQLYGGTAYNIAITDADANTNFDIYPIFASSNEPIIFKIDNLSGSYKNVLLNSLSNQLRLTYEWTDAWQTSGYGKYMSLANNSAMVIVLVPCDIGSNGASYAVLTKSIGSGGGDIDPETIYTKDEINAMMNQKASLTYVNTELAKKEFTANLKALAYQDNVDYLTQVNNRPTLGALADHNTVDYETEVTNKPDHIEKVEIYVNRSSGNDNNDGSENSPVRTIQKAVALALRGNVENTIHIQEGSYGCGWNELNTDAHTKPIEIEGKRIVFKTINNGTVSLHNSGNTSGTFKITKGSNVEFTYGEFEFENVHVMVTENSSLYLDCEEFVLSRINNEIGSRMLLVEKSFFSTESNTIFTIDGGSLAVLNCSHACLLGSTSIGGLMAFMQALSGSWVYLANATFNTASGYELTSDISCDASTVIYKNVTFSYGDDSRKHASNGGEIRYQASISPSITTVYVSPAGNDETGEGTSESPLRTIGKAIEVSNMNEPVHIIVAVGSYSGFSVPRNKVIDIDTVNYSDTVIVNGNIGVSGALTLASGSYTINGNIGVGDNGLFYGYASGAEDFIILQDGYFDIHTFGKAVVACQNVTTTSSDYGVYCRSGGMFVYSNIKKGMVVNNARTAFHAQSGIIIYARDITGTFQTKNAVSYGGIISTGNSNSHILS